MWGSSLRRPFVALASVGGSRALRLSTPRRKRHVPPTYPTPSPIAYNARHEPADAPTHLLANPPLAVALCVAATMGPAALDTGQRAQPADRRLTANGPCLHHRHGRCAGGEGHLCLCAAKAVCVAAARLHRCAVPVRAGFVHPPCTLRACGGPHMHPTCLRHVPGPFPTPHPHLSRRAPTGPAAACAGPAPP